MAKGKQNGFKRMTDVKKLNSNNNYNPKLVNLLKNQLNNYSNLDMYDKNKLKNCYTFLEKNVGKLPNNQKNIVNSYLGKAKKDIKTNNRKELVNNLNHARNMFKKGLEALI